MQGEILAPKLFDFSDDYRFLHDISSGSYPEQQHLPPREKVQFLDAFFL